MSQKLFALLITLHSLNALTEEVLPKTDSTKSEKDLIEKPATEEKKIQDIPKVVTENRKLGEDDKDKPEMDEEPPTIEKYILSLNHRAYSINDKIDHLLFHHNHDVTGKVAQFTPYGIHFLPKYKGSDSVDQKLKMVDHMHSMGGFNPQAGFMTPYLFAHQSND